MAAATTAANFASDYKTFTAKESGLKVVTQYCPEQPYIELRIPSEIRAIRRIVFKLNSHDQGFSDDTHNLGTYEGCNSWFDVTAINPSGHDRISRRHLQSNLHGDGNFREHIICWEHDSQSAEVRDWVCSVQPGDTIQVYPRARYVGWQNYIRAAEIEVSAELSIDDPRSDSSLLPGSVGAINKLTARTQDFDFYRRLDDSRLEIRVIKIHPGLREDDIVCSIEVISLSDSERTPYEGLSYCWGDSKNPKTLRVMYSSPGKNTAQQHLVSVTSNLYEALHYIRREDSPRVFWIDAVCINQKDADERSKQVAIMQQIYSNASGVVVWLGPSSPEARKSIEDARYVMGRYQDAITKSDPRPTTAELHDLVMEHGWYTTDSQLFQYPYFRRAWVVQEVYRAKTVSVYCGSDVLPWSLVLRLNQCINRTMLVPNPIRKNVMNSLLAGLFALESNGNNDNQCKYSPRHSSLGILDAVIRGLDLDATDPRDKLFALLCFSDETANISQLPSLIRPDYKKSVSDVYSDFTRWWISTHQSLQILSSVHLSIGRTWQILSTSGHSDDPDRASWSMWHDGKTIWSRGTLGLLPHTPKYSASGTTLPDISLLESSPSRKILRLRGRIVSTVANLAPYPYYGHINNPDQLHAVYNEIFDPINSRGTWKSVTLQADLLERQPLDSEQELMGKLYQHYNAHINYSSRTGAIRCHHEAFFTTTEKTIGLCPPQAKVGDKIVVLDGGNVPYLIRTKEREGDVMESGPQYEFIGECYLDDYMYGRAAQDNDEHDALPKEIFDLV